MITVDLGELEYFDSDKKEFVYEHGGIVRFEYNLKSIYEWEGKWKKPFLKGELTYEEMVDFFKIMALDKFDTKFLNDEVNSILSNYISDTSTATKFQESQNGQALRKSKTHTSEEIYAMMFSAGIPLEFENRNLNRLLTILRIISIQNSPPKKMSREEVLKQNASLNKQRKAAMNTSG